MLVSLTGAEKRIKYQVGNIQPSTVYIGRKLFTSANHDFRGYLRFIFVIIISAEEHRKPQLCLTAPRLDCFNLSVKHYRKHYHPEIACVEILTS